MIVHTSAGEIDTGRYEPSTARLDALAFGEIESIRDTLDKEAINIGFQIDREVLEPIKGNDWLARTRFALKMRRHNIQILERYMSRRKGQMASSRAKSFEEHFVNQAVVYLTGTQFEVIRDAAIHAVKDDHGDIAL